MCMAFVVGCDKEDEGLTTQQDQIVRYLTSSHDPRLIAIEEVPNAIVENPPFYERLNLNTYRYIATYYDAGRQSKTKVEAGDEVELYFAAYALSSGAPSNGSLYFTNDATLIEQLSKAGLNTEYWSTEPLRVKIGSSDILKGVETSLLDCREGDAVEVYMAYESAYGKKNAMGVIPAKTGVAWFYVINRVIKSGR